MLPIVKRGEVGSWKTFFKRRALRILPPYYLAVLLGIIASLCMGWPVTAPGIFTHLFLVHNLTDHIFELNGALWSIATEFQIYLLFPLLVWLVIRFNYLFLLQMTATIGYLAADKYGSWHQYERNPHYVFIFALGMTAAALVYERSQEILSHKRILNALGMTAIAGILVCYHFWGSTQNIQYTDIFTGILTFTVLTLCAADKGYWLNRWFTRKAVLWIGAFSYSLYLVHQPLQVLFTRFVITPYHIKHSEAFLLRMAFTPVIIMCAYGFYCLVEKPILEMSRRGKKAVKIEEEVAVF